MKEIRTVDAVGHVLCHDLTRIVPGVVKDAAFRKGHIVAEEDVPLLLSMGKETLFVWEKQEGMLHEDEAAAILYELLAGSGMTATPVKEGKINVIAEHDGFFQIDVEKLRALNSLGEISAATRRGNVPVLKGDVLAGARVIPLVVSKDKMDAARAVCGETPILSLRPFASKRYAIVTTGNEVAKGRIEDAFTPVVRKKLDAFGGSEIGQITLADDSAAVTAAIQNFLSKGAEIVVCTGGMSVDPDDRTPLAIKNAAKPVSYGSPVLPGSMFMLAYAENGAAVMGLPGCVMYGKRTVFDLFLPRIMADVPVTPEDFAALGHGGLCLGCETCFFPNCGFGCGV